MADPDVDPALALAIEGLRGRGAADVFVDPTARRLEPLLGLTYTPGDLVLDTVTGQLATVLHAAYHAFRR